MEHAKFTNHVESIARTRYVLKMSRDIYNISCFEYSTRTHMCVYAQCTARRATIINNCRKDRPCQLFEIRYGGHGQCTEVLRLRFDRRLPRLLVLDRYWQIPIRIRLGREPSIRVISLINNNHNSTLSLLFAWWRLSDGILYSTTVREILSN